MSAQDLFEIWAPSTSVWSDWAKPVLFAHLATIPVSGGSTETFRPGPDLDWTRDYRSGTALIVNLPGVAAIEAGVALADRGFRPVPLYNCAATPTGAKSAVDVQPIMSALVRYASAIERQHIPDNAPPAFLIDYDRNPSAQPRPGEFDNRWVVFPQDFPSATFLKANAISRAVVIQPDRSSFFTPGLAADLYEVVKRWHAGGIETLLREVPVRAPTGAASDPATQTPATDSSAHTPLTFGRMSRFRLGAAGILALMFALASRRSAGGGFGRIVPFPSSSGGA